MPGRDAYATSKQCILAAAMVCGRDVGKLLAGKPAMQNCSKSGKPVKMQSRANPGWIDRSRWEGVETKRAAPKASARVKG
jgi:hypothetical protein